MSITCCCGEQLLHNVNFMPMITTGHKMALDSCMTYDGAAMSFKDTDATHCCVHVMNITASSV